jgi:hypothetical protein
MTDFYKPYSNKRELFKFSTLERDKCTPGRLRALTGAVPGYHGSRPGLQVFKGKVKGSAKGASKNQRAGGPALTFFQFDPAKMHPAALPK